MAETIWFTSDSHFNHKNILLFRKGFLSVGEMNEAMIGNWNAKIQKHDRVYHLGDVALGPPAEAAKIIGRLSGNIYLIRGNHDKVAESPLCRDRFEWIKDLHTLKVGDQKIVLCHYAMRVWNCSHYGAWQLHGHSHGTLPELDGYFQMDVGVDLHGFQPLSFDEVRLVMAAKTFQPVDHHVGDFVPE